MFRLSPLHFASLPARAERANARLVAGLLATVASVVVLTGALRPVAAQEAAELQINSEQYIVIDSQTGEVFAQRAADQRSAMASLTKVFTAIQAIEDAPSDYVVVIDESDMPDPRASFMGFSPGESYTLEELLHGLMLPSGNDAAHAIARSLGTQSDEDTPQEAVDRFVGRMNQRVADMGLTDTHLVRPDGWGVPDHYTSPHDLAAFVRYAIQYPRFVELISAASYTLSDGRVLYNNNRMLNWYEDLVGGKTGYDDDSGWCLIEVAERGSETMISVTFDGIHEAEDWYDDNRALLDYAFVQKADRLAAGRDIRGAVVSYKDPDAALIDRTATSGGSIGGQSALDLAALSQGGSGEASQPDVFAERTALSTLVASPNRRETGAATVVAGVVALVLASRAMGAFAQPGRRAADPPRPSPRDRRVRPSRPRRRSV